MSHAAQRQAGAAPVAPVARVRDVVKTFAGTHALRGADLELQRGEIHALIGGNGCGKSTLIKILAGVQTADGGTLETDAGGTLDLARSSPAAAAKAGFHFVHQDHSTFPELTVAENLAIGRGFATGAPFRIKRRESAARARAALTRLGVEVDPEAELGTLGPVDRTMVAIARALQDQEEAHAGILVLDEPTAALPQPEVDELLAALRRYAARGQTILMVTHRLEEVLAVADRISVFRDGLRVTTLPRSEVDHDRMVELMVGEPVAATAAPAARATAPTTAAHDAASDAAGEVVLEARGLTGPGVAGADLTVRAGEIVGVTGLAGAGASELLALLFGDARIAAGELRVAGRPATRWSRRAAMRAGVALVPADRRHQALFPELSVRENLSAATVASYWSKGRIAEGRERREAREDVERYLVRTATLTQPIATLSGGNQQKVMLARWLRRRPRLVLLDEPTQGVDVGARRELWTVVRGAVRAGAGVLAASSDIEDLVGVCDRILIVREGRIAHEIADRPLDPGRITQLLHGAA